MPVISEFCATVKQKLFVCFFLILPGRSNCVELLFSYQENKRAYFVVLSEELFKRATACSCLTEEILILLESVISLNRYIRIRMP